MKIEREMMSVLKMACSVPYFPFLSYEYEFVTRSLPVCEIEDREHTSENSQTVLAGTKGEIAC